MHGGMSTSCPVTIVVITRNRRSDAMETIPKLLALPGRPAVVVVDNASNDGTADEIERRFPRVKLIRSDRNLGAAGRNLGTRWARTPFVAFSDDDSWWASGALDKAAAMLQAFPRLAVVAARVLVGSGEHLDPTCRAMAESGLPDADLPGPLIFGFLACGAIVHRERFLDVGGFPERFGIGGEEAALSLALARQGWALSYVEDIVAYHHPSSSRDRAARRANITRNDLWVAWEFRSVRSALRVTRHSFAQALHDRDVRRGVVQAVASLPSVLEARNPVPPDVESTLNTLDRTARRAARRR